MKNLLLSAALFVSLATPATAGILGIDVFDNGTLIDSLSGITVGTANLVTSDAAFSNITVDVQGSPVLPFADLSSTNLDATSATGFTGSHTLTVDVFQTAVTGHGPTSSTFTVNGLIGGPGPTTESTFQGGTETTLGTLLSNHSFPVGLSNGSAQLSAGAGGFTADALEYSIAFTSAHQSFGGSVELQTNVPEASTWVMVLIGFASLGWAAFRQSKSNHQARLA